jgi:hypothetical protein
LPRAYIERLIAELDDHLADLQEDLLHQSHQEGQSHQERTRDMNAARKPDCNTDGLQDRIGQPTQLAIFAAEQYRARSFWGRHPVFTFLIAPLPMFALLATAFYLVVALPILVVIYFTDYALGWTFAVEEHPWFGCSVLAYFCFDLDILAPLMTAWLLSRVAGRNALKWQWPTAACALLAGLVSLVHFSWKLNPGPHQNGVFTVGLDVGSSAQWLLVDFLPKFALALGIGLALVWLERRRLQGQNSDMGATLSTRPAA